MATFNEPTQWSHALGSKADVRQLPDDTSATTGLASLQKLFQMINQIPLDAGGVAPGRLDFNALFKLLGDSIFYTMNGGLASYNQAYDYPVNRFVAYNNNLYKCVKANGPSASIVVPGTNDSVWQAIPTKIEIPSLIPIATLLAKGIVQLCDNIDANATDNSKALTPYAVARQNYVKAVNGVRADAYGNASITRVNSAASADSATRAAQDITGQQINTTYIKSLAINGRTITYTKGNGATGTITTQDTTYSKLSQFWNDVGYITSAGSCAYATKAALDSAGQQINTTYVKGVTASNATITVTKGNGTTSTATINNVANATKATKAEIATKLNGYDNHNWIYLGWDGANLTMNVDGVDRTKGVIITHLNISSQSVKHATTADSATNATNLGGYPATKYIRSVNSITPDASGNVQLGNFGVITGKIEWFAFNTAPDGYLVCNGANISRTTYANLFAVIGTTYGSGDGSTTFTLPNLIDKFAQGSTIVGTAKSAGIPNITGNFGSDALFVGNLAGGVPAGAFSMYGVGGRHLAVSAWAPAEGGSQRISLDASRSSAVYGRSSTVQPPALTLLPCIKY